MRESAAETSRLTWWIVWQDGPEPIFGLPLWLTAECRGGEVLWALDELYVDYLERFVASPSATETSRRLAVRAGSARIDSAISTKRVRGHSQIA